jgi:hypothetical protein
MLFYVITSLINAVGSFFLGLFVYLKNRKASLNKVFVLFCLSVAGWSGLYFFWLISGTTKSNALLLARALNVAAIFIPITYFHFITVFLNIYQKKKRLVNLGYLFSFFLLLSGFSSLFVRDVEPILLFPWYPKAGVTYHFFILMFFSFIVYSWYLMYEAIKNTTGIVNRQIKYVLIGSLIGFIGGSTNFFPVYDVPIPPLANGLVLIYVILITLAILRYHLFDIKLILTELLVGIFSILLFVQIFLSNSTWQYLWNMAVFIIFLFFGYLFIKSILKEIRIKQKIGEASWKVLEQGEVVSENFKKVTSDRERLLKEWFLSDVNKELETNSLRNKVKELEEKLREK